MYDRWCLVRCRDAGVWFGLVHQLAGRSVLLKEARRVHRWMDGANTLSEMSLRGCGTANIAEPVSEVLLLEACEVIPCEPEAIANLSRSRWGES